MPFTINPIPQFIFKDTRVISNPYTLDRDICPYNDQKSAEEKNWNENETRF